MILKYIIYFLFIPGFVFSAILGLLASWVERKIAARVQWRQGPPWFQPFADILKLLGKQTLVPEGASKFMFLSSPFLGLAGVTLVCTMMWLLNTNTYITFVGDIIVILYLLVLPSLSLMLGGFASGNPLSAIGSSREMKLILAYELPFLIAVFTIVAKAGTILMGGIINQQYGHGMFIMSISGSLSFIVCLLVAQAKIGFSPFDIAEAEQELMGGPLLEYSGTPLAAFRLTKAMMLVALPLFLISMFLGGADLTSNAGLLWFFVKYVIIILLMTLIKNTNPRLRVDQALRFFWGPITVIAIVGFVFAIFGL